jgi:hypothetical protein
MGVTVSYPGVYIEEFTPAPPIQGAPTSIVALLGPAASGPLVTPTLITSWDQFKQVFGSQPLPGFYFWYAAQGFFQNGGQLLYAVRISNAAIAAGDLTDQNAVNTIRVEAKRPGAAGNSIPQPSPSCRRSPTLLRSRRSVGRTSMSEQPTTQSNSVPATS